MKSLQVKNEWKKRKSRVRPREQFRTKEGRQKLRKVPELRKKYLRPLMTRCSRAPKSSHMQCTMQISFLPRESNLEKHVCYLATKSHHHGCHKRINEILVDANTQYSVTPSFGRKPYGQLTGKKKRIKTQPGNSAILTSCLLTSDLHKRNRRVAL